MIKCLQRLAKLSELGLDLSLENFCFQIEVDSK